jgi:hypothetical protein
MGVIFNRLMCYLWSFLLTPIALHLYISSLKFLWKSNFPFTNCWMNNVHLSHAMIIMHVVVLFYFSFSCEVVNTWKIECRALYMCSIVQTWFYATKSHLHFVVFWPSWRTMSSKCLLHKPRRIRSSQEGRVQKMEEMLRSIVKWWKLSFQGMLVVFWNVLALCVECGVLIKCNKMMHEFFVALLCRDGIIYVCYIGTCNLFSNLFNILY